MQLVGALRGARHFNSQSLDEFESERGVATESHPYNVLVPLRNLILTSVLNPCNRIISESRRLDLERAPS